MKPNRVPQLLFPSLKMNWFCSTLNLVDTPLLFWIRQKYFWPSFVVLNTFTRCPLKACSQSITAHVSSFWDVVAPAAEELETVRISDCLVSAITFSKSSSLSWMSPLSLRAPSSRRTKTLTTTTVPFYFVLCSCSWCWLPVNVLSLAPHIKRQWIEILVTYIILYAYVSSRLQYLLKTELPSGYATVQYNKANSILFLPTATKRDFQLTGYNTILQTCRVSLHRQFCLFCGER